MLESLKKFDADLLLFFNHLDNSLFDFIFYWASDKWIWIPFYAFLAFIIYKNEGRNILWILLFIAAAVTVSDQVASTIIKPAVLRLRPCHDPAIADQVRIVNDYCGGKYGFVSSHAANVFTLAAFLTGIFKQRFSRLLAMIWLWAIFVSFSRIYLGVHYPGDVFGGALVGVISGSIFAYSWQNIKARLKFNL